MEEQYRAKKRNGVWLVFEYNLHCYKYQYMGKSFKASNEEEAIGDVLKELMWEGEDYGQAD